MDEAELIARVDSVVPARVRDICRRLREAGHEAYTVGGATRDALLRREPGDWDVATSALPDEVQALFAKTIPTGLQHGTVTVVLGRGADRVAVEVTTFRGEGAYSDARHPDEVHFGVPLREDLARRDFTVNAIAYDPIARTLADPFGGLDDLEAGRLRAVGVPAERFAEDGLRVMRAVRFAAVLELDVDPATEAAIPGALGSLAKVSQERNRVELEKLLASRRPSRGLAIARRTGILGVVLPELDVADDAWDAALARVDACPPGDVTLRAAALLVAVDADDPAPVVRAVLRRLTFSNADREEIVALVVAARERERRTALEDAELRRWLGTIGRERAPRVVALWRVLDELGHSGEGASELRARAQEILADGDPLVVGDLAVSGGDVMEILGVGPGRAIGEVLRALLDRVLAEPSLNIRDRLEPLVREVYRGNDGRGGDGRSTV